MKNISFESLTPLTRLIFDEFSFFLPILMRKYTIYWSYSTNLTPILEFCEIRELAIVKAGHIFGWTGGYSTVHEEFPHKFVRLTPFEN